MPIISKETWDKFDPTEQKEIRELYSALLDALKKEPIGSEEHIRLSSIQDRYASLFGKENLQPKKLTYEDVARELFGGKDVAFIDSDGDIDGFRCTLPNSASKPNVCSSRNQAEKLLAINKLLNVAAFLNKNEDGTSWKPDWEDHAIPKYFIYLNENEIAIDWHGQSNSSIVYFRTQQLAEKAIQILGEDTVRLALSSDY